MKFTKHIRPAIIATLIVFTLAGGLVGLALAGDGDSSPAPQPAVQEQERNDCGECHPDIAASWHDSPHAKAYTDPIFQDSWANNNNDPSCLECHTTNYDVATGEYLTEGVTCEACHGFASEDHPPATVDLNRANEVCGDCHEVTQAEFHVSQHRVAELTCTSCHYSHTNGLRAGTELDQCLICHADGLEGFVAHITHIEDAELSCRDCHGYVSPHTEIPETGLAPTGHDFQASLRSCLDCHEEGIELVPVGEDAEPCPDSRDLENYDLGGREATLRATQLENVLQTVLIQQRNQSALSLVEGGGAGLLIGAVVAWIVSRRLNGNNKADNGGETDEG